MFENLRKEAECALCLETVNNPKTLPCLHSFCLECLEKHAGFARKQLQTMIKCPVCQTSLQIPEGDTFNILPTSFRLKKLVELLALRDRSVRAPKCSDCDENNIASAYCFVCQNFLCTACFEAHQRLKITRGHRSVVIEKLQAPDVQEFINRPIMCSMQYHENQPLEFYCFECKIPICLKCSVVSHNRHAMTDTRKVAELQKMQMKDALEKLEALTVFYEREIKKQTEVIEKSRNEVMTAEKKMVGAVEECIHQLQNHENTMKVRFAEIYEAQQKYCETRLENFDLFLTQLNSCVERGEGIVQRKICAEILQTQQAFIEHCEELLKARKPDIYKPSHVHYMVEQKGSILDRIVVSNTDPSLTLLEEEGQKEKTEKAEAIFTIVTRDSSALQCYNEDDQIKVSISTPTGDQLQTEMKDTKNGKYTVTYTPQCVGQHRVEIQVNGQPLTGSPWFVQVIPHPYQFLFQFGSKGKEQGQFNRPFFITVSDKTSRIAVVDFDNKRTQIFSFDGKFLGERPFFFVFTGSNGEFFFLNDDNHQISLCAEDGKLMRNIDRRLFKSFTYIVCGTDGHLITCEKDDKTIKVLTSDWKHVLNSFSAPDCDAQPWCVVLHHKKFFVSYPKANRVMVFDNAGMYLYDIGSEGCGAGQFKSPSGLVIDSFNRLIVCDVGNSRLQLFTLDGKFVSGITGSFFDNSCLISCAVSNSGHLFVADVIKNCIYDFK